MIFDSGRFPIPKGAGYLLIGERDDSEGEWRIAWLQDYLSMREAEQMAMGYIAESGWSKVTVHQGVKRGELFVSHGWSQVTEDKEGVRDDLR